MYNTLRENILCAWCHVICWHSLTKVTLLFDHFQGHCTIGRQHFLGRNADRAVAGNNETENIIVNSRYTIWMNEHLTLTLLTLLTLMSIFTHFNVIPSWKCSSVKKILCNVTPFFDHNSGVIQHLVSYWLFSLISKENVLSVR